MAATALPAAAAFAGDPDPDPSATAPSATSSPVTPDPSGSPAPADTDTSSAAASSATAAAGTIQASSPAVSVNNAADPTAPMHVVLTASVSGVTEPDTTTSYQWYRVNRTTGAATAIPGATLSLYKPVSADYPYKTKVLATVKKPGYTNLPLTSVTRDFALRLTGSLSFVGTPRPDGTLGAGNGPYTAEVTPGSPTTLYFYSANVSATYQWRRNGANIAGATTQVYTVIPSDVGKVLSFSLKVDYPGFMYFSGVSPNAPKTVLSSFSGGNAPAITQIDMTLSIHPQVSNLTPTADSFTIQWYRSGVAVAGKTGTDYPLTAVDFGKQVTVKVTYRKAGYQPAVSTAPVYGTDAAHNGRFYILTTPALPVITGDVKVGGTLGVASRVYSRAYDDATFGAVALGHQWLRNGVAISGATNPTYTLGTSDKGKTISVRVTVSDDTGSNTLLSNVSTSVATQAIGGASLPGSNPLTTPSLILDGSSNLYTQVLGVASTGITSPSATVPNVVKYQWFRGVTAISKATAAKYTLTQADRGQQVWVRIITSHAPIGGATYTTVVQSSTKSDLTLYGTPATIAVLTDLSVGSTLVPGSSTYTDATGTGVTGIGQAWKWYRTVGKKTTAIAGANGLLYTLQAADVGATISVRVTSGKVGYISHIVTQKTPTATQKVVKGTLQNTGTAPAVAVGATPTQLVATPPDVTGQSPSAHASFTYQWYRKGAKVTGATKATYALTVADRGKNLHVVATAVLAGYNSVALPPSADHDYTLLLYSPEPPKMEPADSWRVGTAVHVRDLYFVDALAHMQSPDSIKYEWLRTIAGKTKVVATTTTPEYTLVAADYNAKITARLATTKAGYITLAYTTPAISQLVLKGHDDDAWTPTVVDGPGLGQVSAGVASLGPATPAPVMSGFVWKRNGVAIPGATAKTYTLVPADFDQNISVQLSISRPNFDPLTTVTKTSAAAKHSIYTDATTQPVISWPSPLRVGNTVTSSIPDFFQTSASTSILGGLGTYTYTWYRSGVAIPGATGQSYTLVAADLGTTITVKVHAAAPGSLAATSLESGPTAIVNEGVILRGTFDYTVKFNVATHKATVTLSGAFATPGVTLTYVWWRYTGLPTVASTSATSFTIPASDASNGMGYTLQLTPHKPGYVPEPLDNPYGKPVNFITRTAAPVISGTPTVGQTLTCTTSPYKRADGSAFVAGANGTISYSWTRNSLPIGTGSTYVVDAADTGTNLACNVAVKAPYHQTFTDQSAAVHP